jgi:hypothetical protein
MRDARRARQRARCGEGHRHGAGCGGRGTRVPAVLHDESGRPRHGARHLPIDRRSPRRPLVGVAACAAWRRCPLHCPVVGRALAVHHPARSLGAEFRVGPQIAPPADAEVTRHKVPSESITSTPAVPRAQTAAICRRVANASNLQRQDRGAPGLTEAWDARARERCSAMTVRPLPTGLPSGWRAYGGAPSAEAEWSVLGALRTPSLYASALRGPPRRTISSMSHRRMPISHSS